MKIRTAWLLMLVEDIRDVSMTVSRLIGKVQDSNFLKTRKSFDMPVITEPLKDISEGDLVRLSYFTTEKELVDLIEGKAFVFADRGIKYEVLGVNGWDLLYEDHDEHLS